MGGARWLASQLNRWHCAERRAPTNRAADPPRPQADAVGGAVLLASKFGDAHAAPTPQHNLISREVDTFFDYCNIIIFN